MNRISFTLIKSKKNRGIFVILGLLIIVVIVIGIKVFDFMKTREREKTI